METPCYAGGEEVLPVAADMCAYRVFKMSPKSQAVDPSWMMMMEDIVHWSIWVSSEEFKATARRSSRSILQVGPEAQEAAATRAMTTQVQNDHCTNRSMRTEDGLQEERSKADATGLDHWLVTEKEQMLLKSQRFTTKYVSQHTVGEICGLLSL